jgi:endonuclease YncB( thermonuclease family)
MSSTVISRFFCSCFRTSNPNNGVELDHIQYKDTVPFVPPVTGGKVIKVYDGDTITIASKLPIANSPTYRFSVRLFGIDSAEMKGKTFSEKEEAIKARDALRALILGKTVTLRNVSTEKYGRVLATVYLGDINICDWMLQHKYALPYDGGTKHRPSEWDV